MAKELFNLPDELLLYINSMLRFEDRLALGQTCRRLWYVTGGTSSYNCYDTLQICDDAEETFLTDSKGKKPKLSFKPFNAPRVLSLTKNIKEISVMMKEVDLSQPQTTPHATPYSAGGFLGPLLGSKRLQNKFSKLKRISLHVDMMVDTIEDKRIFAPYQDLQFAFDNLAFQPFETFIQISLCCQQGSDRDVHARDFLVKSMQDLLKLLDEHGAKTSFEPSPMEGYVDMTVEYGKLEYNFSFFYYNPDMCDGIPDEPTIT